MLVSCSESSKLKVSVFQFSELLNFQLEWFFSRLEFKDLRVLIKYSDSLGVVYNNVVVVTQA